MLWKECSLPSSGGHGSVRGASGELRESSVNKAQSGNRFRSQTQVRIFSPEETIC